MVQQAKSLTKLKLGKAKAGGRRNGLGVSPLVGTENKRDAGVPSSVGGLRLGLDCRRS